MSKARDKMKRARRAQWYTTQQTLTVYRGEVAERIGAWVKGLQLPGKGLSYSRDREKIEQVVRDELNRRVSDKPLSYVTIDGVIDDRVLYSMRVSILGRLVSDKDAR